MTDQLSLFGHNTMKTFTEETRVCTKCGEEKDTKDFHVPYYKKNNEKGYSYTCKSCKKHQIQQVKKLRGIHPQPESMCCDLCGQNKDKLHLDHDHITDTFRGYLCVNCNHGLGKFHDNVEVLKKAISYLEKNRVLNNLIEKEKA